MVESCLNKNQQDVHRSKMTCTKHTTGRDQATDETDKIFGNTLNIRRRSCIVETAGDSPVLDAGGAIVNEVGEIVQRISSALNTLDFRLDFRLRLQIDVCIGIAIVISARSHTLLLATGLY